MTTTQEVVINLVAGSLRAWRGTQAHPKALRRESQPEHLLKLYDIEPSPYCRLVREVLTELDLDALILPCPKGGKRFRPAAEALGGKQQFPLLHDENTGTVLYESADIIAYLHSQYGSGRAVRSGPLARAVAVGTSFLSSATQWRPEGILGLAAVPSRAPEQPLELYSFETSPYSKPVRARLCALEIPYILRNTAKAKLTDLGPPSFRDHLFKAPKGTSRHRKWLEQHTGKVQVPYLVDANTGTAMYESADILRYLDSIYAQ